MASSHHDDLARIQELARAEVLPTRIGRYEILEVLGQGGMGKVYKGYDAQLERAVAIKVLLETESGSSRKALLKEAQLAAKLRHSNIVNVYEVVQDAPQPYIVMEYVAGRTLSQHLKRSQNRPPLAWCLQIIQKVALAIHHAHHEGIIHRDLKPGNIMLGDQDEPKVMDFGLAKMLSAETSLSSYGMVIGTPSYIPPEQMNGDVTHIDQRSDVYGLGAILYEMLTGRPPFVAETIVEIALLVLQKHPEPPSALVATVPQEVDAICCKCLEKLPKRRYQSAQLLCQDIDKYLNAEPISVYSRSPIYRAKKWFRRHQTLATTVLFFLMFFLGISLVVNIVLYSRLLTGSRTMLGESHDLTAPKKTAPPAAVDKHLPATTTPPVVENRQNPALAQPTADHLAYVPALLQDIAQTVLAAKQYNEVEAKLAILDKLLGQYPFFHTYWGKCAFIYALREISPESRKNLIGQALDHLDKVLENSPMDLEAAFLAYQLIHKSWGYAWKKLAPKYLKILDQQEHEYRYFVRAHQMLQLCLNTDTVMSTEKRQQMLAHCERAMVLNPKFADVYALKAHIVYCLGQYQEAAGNIEKALELAQAQMKAGKAGPTLRESWPHFLPNPNYGDFILWQGKIHSRQEDGTKALHCYNLALKESPGNMEAYYTRAGHYSSREQFDLAIQDLTILLAEGVYVLDSYLLRSDAYLRTKQYPLALGDADKAIAVAPDWSLAYLARMRVYQETGKAGEALQEIHKAIELSPKNHKLYLMRANLYSVLGQSQKAVQDVETAMRLPK